MSRMEQTLPCGRPRSWLVDVAAHDDPAADLAPADAEHLRTCAHCRDELADVTRRWSAVRRAAQQPIRVPTDLIGRTLATVRAVRGGLVGRHAETAQQGGVVRIGEPALVLLARRMARDVVEELTGVRLRGVSGGVDRLEVRLAVRYGLVLADVADRVRRELGSVLEHSVGAAAPRLDVVVEDLLVPAPPR